MTERHDCDRVSELLTEVATGAATGPDRDHVSRHVAWCRRCRRELDRLSLLADELLLAAPEQEPSAHFDDDVLARIASYQVRGRGPRRLGRVGRALVAAAAMLLVAGASAGGVWWATSPERQLAASFQRTLAVADGRYFTAAPLRLSGSPDDRQVGHVFLYDGSPSWLVVVLSPTAGRGAYDIVVTTHGRRHRVGRCIASASGCAVADTVGGPIRGVSRVRLMGPDGEVARANLYG